MSGNLRECPEVVINLNIKKMKIAKNKTVQMSKQIEGSTDENCNAQVSNAQVSNVEVSRDFALNLGR